MSYVLAIPSTTPVYPASHAALQAAYPSTLFPDSLAGLEELHVYPVTLSALPEHNPATHKVVEVTPAGSGSTWTQAWSVAPLTPDELAARVPVVPTPSDIEDRLAALDARIAALETKVAALEAPRLNP